MGGAEPNEYAYNGPDPVHNEELRLGKRVWFLMKWCELYEKCVSFGENVWLLAKDYNIWQMLQLLIKNVVTFLEGGWMCV